MNDADSPTEEVSEHPTPPPLRIGLLLDDLVAPAWVAEIVRQIAEAPFAEIVLLAVDASPKPPPKTLGERVQTQRHAAAWIAYERLDRALFSPAHDPYAPVDLGPVVGDAPRLEVVPERQRFSDRFPEPALDALREAKLDVVFRFGFRILRGEVLEVARHGVWSYHHGDNRVNRGGPPALWEVFRQEPTTGAILQRLTERLDGGEVLERVQVPTDRRSVSRNRAAVVWRSVPLAVRALKALASRGERSPEPEYQRRMVYDGPLYRRPTNGVVLAAAGRIAMQYARDRLRRWGTIEQWQLAYAFGSTLPELRKFRVIEPPPDRFWADPFPVVRDGRYFLFFEEYLLGRAKGRIAVMELTPDGPTSDPQPVLELDTHLSYPFLIAHEGELYMVPENAASGDLRAWRCERFPDRWQPAATLLEGVRIADASFIEHQGSWFMWAPTAEPRCTTYDETWLYVAPHPLGPYRKVGERPVVSDPRAARGAGAPFWRAGTLVRPAQDGSVRYGRCVRFMAVEGLGSQAYREHEIDRFEPLWDESLLATHTFNQAGRLFVIDQQRRRRL